MPEHPLTPEQMKRIADEYLEQEAQKRHTGSEPLPPASAEPPDSLEELPTTLTLPRPRRIETLNPAKLLEVSRSLFNSNNLPDLASALPARLVLSPENL